MNKRLGALIVRLNGAVATTFTGGIGAIKNGFAKPVSSHTQLGTIRLGTRNEDRFPLIQDFDPYIASGGKAFGYKSGELYVDAGTIFGYRAIKLLSKESEWCIVY